MFDLLLQGGFVFDGSGAKGQVADVAVSGGQIAAVGRLQDAPALKTLDASGLTVAPGFIDIHTHSDLNLLTDPRALSALRQGVTTEVIGNCGFSAAPALSDEALRTLGEFASGPLHGDWRTFGEYLEVLSARSPAINVVAQVGHGALRLAVPGLAVPGLADRPATEDEVHTMKGLLHDALDEGARGFSTGLEYSPGADAELSELQSLVAEIGGKVYSSHIRSRNGDRIGAAVDEALATAARTEAHLQISHLGPRSPMSARGFDAMLDRIGQANREGAGVGFDVLMYEWGPHTLVDILPGWLQRLPYEQVRRALARPDVMQEIRMNSRSSVQFLFSIGRAHKVDLVFAPRSPEWVGMNFQQIAEETDRDPFEAAAEVIIAAGPDFANIGLATPYTDEALIRRLVADPLSVPSSDGAAVCKDGPLAGADTWRHSYGWAAHFLEEYIVGQRILTLEEGVRRLTAQPARYFGLEDRGLIRAGFAADLVVFDPPGVRDRSVGPDGPDYADGFRYVLVNGQLAVENGLETGARAGQVL